MHQALEEKGAMAGGRIGTNMNVFPLLMRRGIRGGPREHINYDPLLNLPLMRGRTKIKDSYIRKN